ncbi:tuberin [Cimex lectularius]|uniref:Rap-GAP domain-containing protein n=1 Tax=Cimex lectularius TaxID=79782 RepID=A0A8I6SCE5_CIMLE|nr:tuberin [Cimex lectularius]XP_014260625.1 tuberin [Cimex lectularius]
MSSKDKETKTMDKLRQLFRIKAGPQGSFRIKEDFILTVDMEKDLSSDSPLNVRIKTIKELTDVVLNQRLEDNAAERLWALLKDLLAENVSRENRHLVFNFFRSLVQGQNERIGLMRAEFFKLIKNHNIPEDIGQRLDLLQSLTDKGKYILYIEEEVGGFMLNWMPAITVAKRELDFLKILINLIKYNASYIDEDIITGIVQSICFLCCQSDDQNVVLQCLQVLDTIVCYTNLPCESLPPFIEILCRTVNLEIYCPSSWKIMRNLLGTHLGHSSLYTMSKILKSDASLTDCGLLRGAIFYISMALWGDRKVLSLKCTATSILPSFYAALRCKHTLVMFEIMLSIQNLVNKHGNELLDPAWCVVLDIINDVIGHIEETPPSQSLNQVNCHLHETLNSIEQLIETGMFNGCVRTVFDIIERCSSIRPESSVQRLISYLAATITPARNKWLDQLDCLLIRFYTQEKRTVIRLNVLSILANVVETNRRLFEKELVAIVLKHLYNVSDENDRSVRTSAAKLLVDLFLNCEPKRSLEIIAVLEKLLNRAFDHEENAKGEEDAEDIKVTTHGLVRGLTHFMYFHPPTPAIRAFTLITSHLETHYSNPARLSKVTTIRSMMLECLLRLRADSHYRVGLAGHNPPYSMFLMAHNSITSNINNTSGDLLYTLPITLAIKAIIKAFRHELDWKVMLLLLQEVSNLLKNRALLVSKHSSDVDIIANALCGMVCEKSLNLPERLKNTPPKFTRTDFHNYVFPVLASLVSYHAYLEPTLQQRLIKCLEFGLASRSARQCVIALTICILEMRDAMVKLLPEVLLNLSKISATVHIAIPILEFLSTLTQLPKVFANFVGDQYMSVFAISLPYTNPFRYNHYTVSLAHHVIAAWFLKCRLPFRRDFVKFITTGLKANLIPFEEGHLTATKPEIINEDSSNRKRSSSLTEQGSRKPGTPPVSARIDLKPHTNNTLTGAFHKELTETCLDLMAMYTFSTCSPLPRRQSTAELLLNGGQSMKWLLGNKLITVTTSGCTLKALKHGLCDRCFQVCRIQTEPSFSPETDDKKQKKTENKSTESIPSSNSTAPNTPDEEKPAFSESDTKMEHLIYGAEKNERQVCSCWCKGWAEIHIRRPTGSMSWAMRLQNEPHSAQMKDFTNSDISTLFLPSFASKNSENQAALKAGKRVGSEPVSIPCSPVRRNLHQENDDFDYMTEDGTGRSRNPVRRSNSSPDMSSNWKNPILSVDDSELGENKKKQTYTKDMRVNCEAIPEEMGTTPPTSDALLLAQSDVTDAKPPVPTSPRIIPREIEPRGVDPSGLPPLAFRDRGHTISVMSPVKKPTQWDLAPKSPKPKNTPHHRSGVNPSFVFLQLYHSAHFGDSYEKPLLVTNSNSVQSTMKNLDWVPPYEVHKVGVLYVGPGQANSEIDILRNEYGSPRYVEFLQRLGTLIDLAEADRQQVFLGGLQTDGKDGKFAYIWQDDVMQVIFHVATLMPNSPTDLNATSKKLHIGNNFVTIVYNDSGEEYNFQTVKAQFNYAVVVVEPLEHGTNQVIVKAKEEVVQHICHTEYKIISDQSVAILARQLALHSNLASMISSKQNLDPRESYASNWLERLRLIKRIHTKLQQEAVIGEDRAHSRHGARRSHLDDFTEYT